MRTLAILALLASSAAAQPVTIAGRVEPAAAPPSCAAGATHRVVDTSIYLFSSTVNLNSLPAGNLRIIGTDVSAGCPLVQVNAIEIAKLSASICNTPALGCLVTLDMCPSPTTGTYLIFAAAGTNYLPVSVETGTFLLDPPFFFLTSGVNNAVCQSQPLQILGPAVIVGLDAFFQVASLPTTYPAEPALLSNVVKMTIQPPSAPCTNFECY